MNFKLKLFCLALVAMCITTTVNAQRRGDMAVGGNLSIGTGHSYTNFGFGGKFQWNPLDQLRIEPSVNYFFKKDDVSIWDMSGNVHYLVPIASNITVYPLAGIGFMSADVNLGKINGVSLSGSRTEFAFNMGAGIDYKITDNWVGNFEFKYKLVTDIMNRAIFSVGVVYLF